MIHSALTRQLEYARRSEHALKAFRGVSSRASRKLQGANSAVHDVTSDNGTSQATPAEPTSLDALFKMQSRRRVFGSPVLPLEAVAVQEPVQTRIEQALQASKLTQREVRRSSKLMDSFVAPETAFEKREPKRGPPIVRAPPEYSSNEAISYVATRSPGTLATNVYVMCETRRSLPQFRPESMLDFGAGIGASVMAAARVFNEDPFDAVAEYMKQLDKAEMGKEDKYEMKKGSRSFLTQATLIDRSAAMRTLASQILPVDENVGTRVKLSRVESLKHIPAGSTYDVVCASYSLSETVREAMVKPVKDMGAGRVEAPDRDERISMAEKRLKRYVRALWSHTAPGGVFVIIEDGTAAGFEAVLFAREVILRMNSRTKSSQGMSDLSENDEAGDKVVQKSTKDVATARVIAPCLHSEKCPLDGSVTRHRICRFEQRLNRPRFLRNSRPLPTGHQDEYFSYIVIQKQSNSQDEEISESQQLNPWGRLVRAPLTKGKHVILDACTTDGALERRVVSKKNAAEGHYQRARKAKWGDIWPVKPESDPQPVNF